jgi:hypothetical protein
MTLTLDKQTAHAGKPAAKRHPCGFCATGHHDLCPGIIRNGALAKIPVWSCLCSEEAHTLGMQPPRKAAEIIRMPASALAGLRKVLDASSGEQRTSHAASKPRMPAAVSDADAAAAGLHHNCTNCGLDFGHWIEQAVCGSAKMCAKRKELGDPTFGRPKRKPAQS